MAGDYHAEALVRGLAKFLAEHAPRLSTASGSSWLNSVQRAKEKAAELQALSSIHYKQEAKG